MVHIINKIKKLAKELKQEIVLIYYSLWDKRTPFIAKFFALLATGYILSPIDLIPDFVPILGLLDDLVIIPLLISLTLALTPKDLIEDIRQSIDVNQKLHKKWYFVIPFVIIYLLIGIWIFNFILWR
jgi:uncharacterized membrane protein YkvA (DUF1232 family)